jgi:NADPH2:quinone reductase
VKAIRMREPGGPEVLELATAEPPETGPTEVLVAVELAAVNFADVNARRATYAGRGIAFQRGLGLEVYGRVAETGVQVSGFQPGDRVAGFCRTDGYAELAACDQRLLWRVPDDIPDEQAAAFAIVGQTAYHLLHSAARLRDGDSVLITAAAGGVGTAAVQVARLLGAGLIVAAASSAERARRALPLGADAAISYYAPEDLKGNLAAAVGTPTVAVALDAVGGAVRAQALDCLAPFGRLIQYGNSSGGAEHLPDARSLRDRLVSVGGVRLAEVRSGAPELLRDSGDRLLGWLGQGRLRLPIAAVLPLADAAEAHRRLESRQVVGKLLLATR